MSDSFANDVLNSLTASIAVLDARGAIIAVNEAWRRFARENDGDGETFYVGANYLTICEDAVRRGGEETAVAALRGIQEVMRGERVDFTLEYPCHSPTEERWFLLRVTRFLCATASFVVAHENITARKRVEEELLRAKQAIELTNRELAEALAREQVWARVDSLTGALNRRYFFDLAEHEFAVARRYHHPLSVILFDADHFKEINDTRGHQCGDEVLKRIAGIAQRHLREADLLARYGGEEFIVLLPESTAEQAAVVAERIRHNIAADRMETSAGEVGVTISAGIADVLPEEDTLDRLIQRADQALYAAKQAGRNRSVLAS